MLRDLSLFSGSGSNASEVLSDYISRVSAIPLPSAPRTDHGEVTRAEVDRIADTVSELIDAIKSRSNVSAPDSTVTDDVPEAIREIGAELKRMNNITVDGMDMQNGPQGLALIARRPAPTAKLLNRPTKVRWAKAKQNWSRFADNGCYVLCHPCSNHNGDDADEDTTIRVYLPRNGSKEDPNVVSGAVIPYMATTETVVVDGKIVVVNVCVGPFLDGKIEQSYKLWKKGAEIPPGWEREPEASAKTVSFNEEAPEEGYDKHGGEDNNHELHADHEPHDRPEHTAGLYERITFGHTAAPTPFTSIGAVSVQVPGEFDPKDEAGAPGSVPIRDEHGNIWRYTPEHIPEQWQLNWDKIQHDLLTPHTPHEEHTETSNWPPYFVISLIKRIDNSSNA